MLSILNFYRDTSLNTMNTLSMPHDALFKLFLMDVEIAKEFLKIHLPVSLQQEFDFNTLALAPGAFVEDNLSQHYSDIVYSIQLINGQGRAYILVEHESAAGQLTPFKLSRYQSGIMKQDLNQGHALLPVVVPLIFYRGTGPYRGPLSLLECFKHKSLAQKIFGLTHPIQLITLSAIPDEVLVTHKRCAVMSLAQKHIHSCDLTQLAPKIFELFERYPISVEKRNGLLYYLAKEGRGIDKQFVQSMLNIAPHYRENIMSAAHYLMEEGRQVGLQEGRQVGLQEGRQVGLQEGRQVGLQEGRQEGQQEAALKIAKNLLACSINHDLIKQATQLSDDKIKALSC